MGAPNRRRAAERRSWAKVRSHSRRTRTFRTPRSVSRSQRRRHLLRPLRSPSLVLPSSPSSPSSRTRRRPSNAARLSSPPSPTSNTAPRAKQQQQQQQRAYYYYYYRVIIFLFHLSIYSTHEHRRSKAARFLWNA